MRNLVSAGAVEQNSIGTTGIEMSRDEVPNASSPGRVVVYSAKPMDTEKMTTRQIEYGKSKNIHKA